MRKLTFLSMVTIGAVLLVGWSGAVASTPIASSAASNGVNPNGPETLPPGDIPDTTAYVPYAVPGAGYTVSIPEGWSRANVGGVVSFTSNLNAVRISAAGAHGSLTVASVRQSVLPKLASTVKGYKLVSVGTVTRKAGPAIRTVYLGYSPRNPVTNKFGVLAFERYDFLHKGRVVTLVLSSPNGSDNVDPWKKITNSLVFTR